MTLLQTHAFTCVDENRNKEEKIINRHLHQNMIWAFGTYRVCANVFSGGSLHICKLA